VPRRHTALIYCTSAAVSFAFIIRMDGYFGDLYNNIVDGGRSVRCTGGQLVHSFGVRSVVRLACGVIVFGSRRKCSETVCRPCAPGRPSDLSLTGLLATPARSGTQLMSPLLAICWHGICSLQLSICIRTAHEMPSTILHSSVWSILLAVYVCWQRTKLVIVVDVFVVYEQLYYVCFLQLSCTT